MAERVGGVVGPAQKKKPRKPPALPPPDWGNTFTNPTIPRGPVDFWGANPIPQTGPLLPTTKPEAIDAILRSDPGYQAALANLNAEGVSDRASRDAAIRRALVMFGSVPNIPPDFLTGGTISEIADPTTRSLAEQNTKAGLSIMARLVQAAQDARNNTVANLGARGLFNSGETGWRLQRGAQEADRAKYDATNQLLDYMAGVQAAYAANERQRKRDALALSQGVIQNYNPPPNPTPVPSVPPIVPPIPPPPPKKKKPVGGTSTKVM